jgi:hypothetical protein
LLGSDPRLAACCVPILRSGEKLAARTRLKQAKIDSL